MRKRKLVSQETIADPVERYRLVERTPNEGLKPLSRPMDSRDAIAPLLSSRAWFWKEIECCEINWKEKEKRFNAVSTETGKMVALVYIETMRI